MSFAALITAAGESRRMGPRNKLLMDMGGTPVVVRVLEAVRGTGVQEICVVLGHEAEAVRTVLAEHADACVKFVTNPHYRSGLASSLVCGLASLPGRHQGVVVCLGDMPFVEPSTIEALCAAFHEGDYAVVPVWEGQWGNPVLLSAEAAGDARGLTGDRGARALLRRHAARVREVPALSGAVLRDIDREGDFRISSMRKISAQEPQG